MRIYTSPSPPLSYLPPNSLLLASTPVSPLPTAQILPSLKAQETFQKVQKRIPAIYAHHYSTIKHIEPTSQLKTLPEVADKYRKLKKSMLVRDIESCDTREFLDGKVEDERCPLPGPLLTSVVVLR